MRRTCIFIIGFLLVLQVLVLCCAGLSVFPIHTPDFSPPEIFTSLDELYEKYPDVESLLMEEYSHSFVKPQNFKFWGEFEALTLLWDVSDGTQRLYSYAYQLVDENGCDIKVEIIVKPKWFNFFWGAVTEGNKAYFGELESRNATKHGDILYLYDDTQKNDMGNYDLESVTILNGQGIKYVITTDWKNVSELKSDLLSQLLYAETATEAANEIMARLNGTYVAPWVYPTAICGGVVVLAGAAIATVVVIRRKKRGGVEDTVETTPSSV